MSNKIILRKKLNDLIFVLSELNLINFNTYKIYKNSIYTHYYNDFINWINLNVNKNYTKLLNNLNASKSILEYIIKTNIQIQTIFKNMQELTIQINGIKNIPSYQNYIDKNEWYLKISNNDDIFIDLNIPNNKPGIKEGVFSYNGYFNNYETKFIFNTLTPDTNNNWDNSLVIIVHSITEEEKNNYNLISSELQIDNPNFNLNESGNSSYYMNFIHIYGINGVFNFRLEFSPTKQNIVINNKSLVINYDIINQNINNYGIRTIGLGSLDIFHNSDIHSIYDNININTHYAYIDNISLENINGGKLFYLDIDKFGQNDENNIPRKDLFIFNQQTGNRDNSITSNNHNNIKYMPLLPYQGGISDARFIHISDIDNNIDKNIGFIINYYNISKRYMNPLYYRFLMLGHSVNQIINSTTYNENNLFTNTLIFKNTNNVIINLENFTTENILNWPDPITTNVRFTWPEIPSYDQIKNAILKLSNNLKYLYNVQESVKIHYNNNLQLSKSLNKSLGKKREQTKLIIKQKINNIINQLQYLDLFTK